MKKRGVSGSNVNVNAVLHDKFLIEFDVSRTAEIPLSIFLAMFLAQVWHSSASNDRVSRLIPNYSSLSVVCGVRSIVINMLSIGTMRAVGSTREDETDLIVA